MAMIRTQGDDGGETENGVRDTNTRDTDTYSSLKIESNYRQGAKRKMRREEKNEERGSDERKCVVEEEITGTRCQRKVQKNHEELKINCLIYNMLNIDP